MDDVEGRFLALGRVRLVGVGGEVAISRSIEGMIEMRVEKAQGLCEICW